MAYPIITDQFRVQVIMHGNSGLPEDQYVNNWYFRNDDQFNIDPDILAGWMKSVLDAFYGQVNGTATNTVAYYLSGRIDSVTYKVYDLGQPAPRYPIVEPLAGSWVGGAASILPEEVACCLSYKAGNGPRKRGRLYIGPLNIGAMDSDSGEVRPAPAFVTALGESAENVLNTSENVTWMQVSPTAAAASEVEEVWVDDAFDTQRSRGAAATSRRRWNAAGEIV